MAPEPLQNLEPNRFLHLLVSLAFKSLEIELEGFDDLLPPSNDNFLHQPLLGKQLEHSFNDVSLKLPVIFRGDLRESECDLKLVHSILRLAEPANRCRVEDVSRCDDGVAKDEFGHPRPTVGGNVEGDRLRCACVGGKWAEGGEDGVEEVMGDVAFHRRANVEFVEE